jgi:flagellar protein FlaI
MLDATMPDGSRIQMTLSSEITTKGSTFTIRKFRSDPITPVDLINYNTMSVDILAYLWMVVEHGLNAMIAGGTASGKTSVLNAISLFIPHESKIVSIEETREINLPHSNWIPGVTRLGFGEIINDRLVGEIDLFDLMKAALRQRPEYILVGEIRGREAYVLFQAMATGHTTYSTMHADSTQKLVNRLEGKPINVPRQMMQSLDIVAIQINVKKEGKNVRRTHKIVEIIDIDSDTQEIVTNEVFQWDSVTDDFIYNSRSYSLEIIREKIGFSSDEIQSEFENRKEILLWMQRNHIRDFKQVAHIVDSYREQRDVLLEQIRKHPDKKLFINENEDIRNLTPLPSQKEDEDYTDDSKENGLRTKVQSLFL